MNAALSSSAAGKPIEVWFQDEARIGQQGTLTRVWAPRATRPRAPRARRYTATYLFGAVCPERDVSAALVLPKANAWAMDQHLKEFAHHVAPGAHAVVVLDQAGWHDSRCLDAPDNITLLPLPSYSPELNPVENVWQYLRQNFLSNRVYDDEETLIDACCTAWNTLIDLPDKITEITSREWANAVIN